jgi:voltage-gated sodium channel
MSDSGCTTLPAPAGVRAGENRLRTVVESSPFAHFITAVIVINAITLGLETSGSVMARAGPFLNAIDRAALLIFTLEIGLRLWVYRARFFTDGWSLFDFSIVAVSWLPAAGGFSVLRALRILRVLRLLAVVPQMRSVIGALFRALPGMGSIVAVLLLVFYVAAVMATKLFGAEFPQWFGSIGASMFSLFQVMTLESWAMGMARPIMESNPLAWAFFVPFVIVTSFMVLNLFIALIVNSMQIVHQQDREEAAEAEEIAHGEREQLMAMVRELRLEVRQLSRAVQSNGGRD